MLNERKSSVFKSYYPSVEGISIPSIVGLKKENAGYNGIATFIGSNTYMHIWPYH